MYLQMLNSDNFKVLPPTPPFPTELEKITICTHTGGLDRTMGCSTNTSVTYLLTN